jgi:hypothetical protein
MVAGAMELYRHNEGGWTNHRSVNYRRLRFESTGVITAEPRHITHKADGTERRRQIELIELYAAQPHEPEGGNNPADSIYKSEIGECFHAPSKHVRRLVGNIPDIAMPANFDCTEPTDLIVATDGSILFRLGYHSWLVLTKYEHTLSHGGGPDDGAPLYMSSYRRRAGNKRGTGVVRTDQHQDSRTSM